MQEEEERGWKDKEGEQESGIAWLAVSGWVLKLKSFGGIRERDVERARGCGDDVVG